MTFRNHVALTSMRQKHERQRLVQEMHKYFARKSHIMGGAKRAEIDGYKFASAKEAKRYSELKLMEHGKIITDLTVHPSFPIVWNGVQICRVIADFSYRDLTAGKQVVEDVKDERIGSDGKVTFSTDTRLSKLGRKLVLAAHGIEIVVVK